MEKNVEITEEAIVRFTQLFWEHLKKSHEPHALFRLLVNKCS